MCAFWSDLRAASDTADDTVYFSLALLVFYSVQVKKQRPLKSTTDSLKLRYLKYIFIVATFPPQ